MAIGAGLFGRALLVGNGRGLREVLRLGRLLDCGEPTGIPQTQGPEIRTTDVSEVLRKQHFLVAGHGLRR